MLKGLEAIEGLTPEMQEQINALAKGLVDKKTELEGKVANSQQLTAAEKQKLVELESFISNADIQSAKDAEDWQAASDLQKAAWETEKQSMTDRLTGYESNERTRLITDGIRSELTALNVNPLLADALTSYFETQSKVIDGEAMIGEQTQSEHIAAWAGTDSGKASILGQQNSNSGGLGGDKSQAAAPDTLEACKGNKALEAAYFNKQLEG